MYIPQHLPTLLLALLHLLPCTHATLPIPFHWWPSICRGGTLDQAMRHPAPLPRSYITAPTSAFDGPLYAEFAQWGYKESFSAASCDFDKTWGLGHAFEALGLDPRSTARGGPNQCFVVAHGRYDGDVPLWKQRYTVDGRGFRVCCTLSLAPCVWELRED